VSLKRVENLEILGGEDFVKGASQNESKLRCTIRVDCCGSISAALENAFVYKRLGLRVTFFLNHNSAYWKISHHRRAHRSHSGYISDRIVAKLIKMGHDVGLHNDILGLVAKGLDAQLALESSVAFLRRFHPERKLGTFGMAAHNSAWTYGVENFHVFSEYTKDFSDTGVPTLSLNGTGLGWEINIPISVSNPRVVGSGEALHFGVDAIRNRKFLHQYFIEHPSFRRGYNWETWLLGQDSWVTVDYAQGKIEFPVDMEGVLDFIRTQSGSGVILIHPEYCSEGLGTRS
jgi:hypothetical protein